MLSKWNGCDLDSRKPQEQLRHEKREQKGETCPQNGTAVIASGLREGERVIKTGTVKIRANGTKVKEAPPPLAPGEMPPSSDGKKTN